MVRTSSFNITSKVNETGCPCSDGGLMRTLCLLAVLQAGLQDNFAEVQVSVVECPDLTEEPFQFPVKGKKSLAAALHA